MSFVLVLTVKSQSCIILIGYCLNLLSSSSFTSFLLILSSFIGTNSLLQFGIAVNNNFKKW